MDKEWALSYDGRNNGIREHSRDAKTNEWKFREEQNIYMVLRDLPTYYLIFVKEKILLLQWRNLAGTTLYQETLDKPRLKNILQNNSSFEESALFKNVKVEKRAEEIFRIKED